MRPTEGPAASRRGDRSRSRFVFAIPAAALCATAFLQRADADDAPSPSEVQRLRDDLEAERRARADLERRLSALEKAPPAADRAPTPSKDEIGAAVESYLQEKDLFDAAPR